MSLRYVTILFSLLVSNFIFVFTQSFSGSIGKVILFYFPVIGLFLLAEKIGINKKEINWGIGVLLITGIILIDLLVLRI